MLFLIQDGITNGAIYALLGLATVLVFAVTRVILIPQGEFVTYGALTYASLASGQMPGTARLALVMGIAALIGVFLYRIAFQPLAHTSVLVLLIASVGCHLALQGLGLLFFGAEGQRGPAVADTALNLGPLRFTGQSLAVYAITVAF